MIITLVRHTTLEIEPSICYGQSDIDVSSNFIHEQKALSQKLVDYEFDAVYSSPLQRCHKLAYALCEDANLNLSHHNIVLDERLKELHFGDWELHPWESVPRDIFDVWANDYANLAPPNGETFSQLQTRAKSFVDEINSQAQHQHVLVVTHGGLIRALIAAVLELPLKRLFRITVDYASVTQIEFAAPAAEVQVPKLYFVNK